MVRAAVFLMLAYIVLFIKELIVICCLRSNATSKVSLIHPGGFRKTVLKTWFFNGLFDSLVLCVFAVLAIIAIKTPYKASVEWVDVYLYA